MCSVALGFRAERGGAVVVGIAAIEREPRLILSTFLATAAEGDRVSREPYHVAAEMMRGGTLAQAEAAIAEGRARQDQLAEKGLAHIVDTLKPAVAALLVNRAGWITDTLHYALSAPEHPPVAEGLAVRDALRFAIDRAGIKRIELDEKSLLEEASKLLGDVEPRLKALGAAAGRPWRKEQKLACLSAWLALETTKCASPD